MKTSIEALATHLNNDVADLRDYEYKSGRFSKRVFAFDHGYYCAVRNVSELPKPTRKNEDAFEWVEIPDRFVNAYGWLIFTHKL